MEKPRSIGPIAVAALLLLPVIYVGSYLALVSPFRQIAPYGTVVTEEGKTTTLMMDIHYRVGGRWANALFWPLEQIDRRMRPHAWDGSALQLPNNVFNGRINPAVPGPD